MSLSSPHHNTRQQKRTALQKPPEHNKVVALVQQGQPGLVLLQKSHQFGRRSVIGKLHRVKLLVMQHPFKKESPNSAPLAALMHIKVQHTHWRGLPEGAFVLHA